MSKYKYVYNLGPRTRKVVDPPRYVPTEDSVRFHNGQLHASTPEAQLALIKAATKRVRRQVKAILEHRRANS